MANNPRLAIEVSVEGMAKATKDFSVLQKQLKDTEKEFQKANFTATELEGELNSLSGSLARGVISQSQYNKEAKSIGVALASARQSANSYQSKIQSLNATIAQGSNIGRQYGNAMNNLQGVHDSVTKGIRGSTTIGVEFGRMLGDLPYGIQGVANNLQQLTNNVGYYTKNIKESLIAQGKQATTLNVTKAFLGGLLSPMSLVTIGISALTAGWVWYEKQQQKSNKATKEAQKSLTDYIDTLNGVARAQANGQVNALKELTTIDQLYKATQNVNIPMEKRIENAKELVKQGGEVFKSVSAESIVAGEASEAYDKLTNSIRATAMAQAYMQKMTENSTAVLNNNIKALNDANEILKLNQEIQSYRRNISTSATGGVTGASSAAEYKTIAILEEQRNERVKSINDLNKSTAEILKEQNMLQKGIDTQLEKGAKLTSDTNKNTSGIKSNISDINNLTNSIVKQGLSEFDAKLFEINNKYSEIYKKISDPNILGLAKQNEIAEKLRLNIEKLAYTLDNSLQRNIQITGGVTLPTSLPNLAQNTQRINKDRNSNLTNDLSKEVKRSIVRGIGSAFTDLQSNIGNLGTNFYEVFSNVFNRLSSSIGGILTDVLGKTLGQSLVDKIEAGADIGALGSKLGQALIGGASIAGGLISSLVPKTSGVGQGLGGALSGAGMGAALGSIVPGVGTAIGAVAGGLIGALSGIFGASNAKKQEELQKKQLEEQEKQTALMERQAQLTYSSSVIGQQVRGGIVTSVDRDAYGNLVATLKGTDIKLALQRLDGGR